MATDSVSDRTSHISRHFKLQFIFIIVLISFALQACVSGGHNLVFHSLNFDTHVDSKNVIEMLDYQYGDCRGKGTVLCADKHRVAKGETFPGTDTYGYLPRGEFLYVKWRVKETGQVFEDRVDLTRRLPADMKGYGIHFVAKGEQLYVFLIPPPGIWPVYLSFPVSENMAVWLKKCLIYPDHPKTYPVQIRK